jgi:hypothetical protein
MSVNRQKLLIQRHKMGLVNTIFLYEVPKIISDFVKYTFFNWLLEFN